MILNYVYHKDETPLRPIEMLTVGFNYSDALESKTPL